MTDEDKALVDRLFAMADEYDSGHHESWPTIDALEIAAHRIEAQAAEIEKLREALDRIYMEDRRVVDRWRQSLATGDSHLDTQIVLGRFAEIARAALGETK